MIGHCLSPTTLTQPSPQGSASTAMTATTKDKSPRHQGNVPLTLAATARKKDSCTVQRTVGHCEVACLPKPPSSFAGSWTSSPRPGKSHLRSSSAVTTTDISSHHQSASPGHKNQDTQTRPLTIHHHPALAKETKAHRPDHSPLTVLQVLAMETKTPTHSPPITQARSTSKSWVFKPKSNSLRLLQQQATSIAGDFDPPGCCVSEVKVDPERVKGEQSSLLH